MRVAVPTSSFNAACVAVSKPRTLVIIFTLARKKCWSAIKAASSSENCEDNGMVVDWLDDWRKKRRLLLMRFELGNRQVILRPAFRTANPHRILKYIHFTKRQGRRMGA
jgi:hypothetical protein